MLKFLNCKNILLPLLLFLHTSCWFVLKPIAPVSDDLCYVQNAHKMLQHKYTFTESPKDQRLTVIIPAMIFIKILGENPYAISLWSLLCSLASIILLYFFILKYFDPYIAFVSSFFLSFNLIQIIYSTVLFPDLIVAFFAICFIFYLYKNRINEKINHIGIILMLLILLLGFFAKQIILLVLPFVFCLFVFDFYKKNHLYFWNKFWLYFLILFLLVLLISKIFFNDFFFLYTSVEKNHNEVFVEHYTFINFFRRVTYEPMIWLNSELGYIFIFILSIPSIITGLKMKQGFNNTESFFAFYALVLLLTYWLGTTSVIRFAPLLLLDRMWMLLTIPFCILSGFTINKVAKKELSNNSFYFLIIFFFMLSIINAFTVSISRGSLYAMFGLVLLITKFFPEKRNGDYWSKTILLLLPYLILAMNFLYSNSNYR